MENPAEQDEQELHEGTQALQDIAEDVEQERARRGRSDVDVTVEEDDAETREDHLDGDDKDVPMGSVNPLPYEGGHQR